MTAMNAKSSARVGQVWDIHKVSHVIVISQWPTLWLNWKMPLAQLLLKRVQD